MTDKAAEQDEDRERHADGRRLNGRALSAFGRPEGTSDRGGDAARPKSSSAAAPGRDRRPGYEPSLRARRDDGCGRAGRVGPRPRPSPGPRARARNGHVAWRALRSGLIEGVVMDERGRPLGGAMVSALGAISALAVTDRDGAFVLRALPAGAYLVRAHLAGFRPVPPTVRRGRPRRRRPVLGHAPAHPRGPDDPPAVLAAGLGQWRHGPPRPPVPPASESDTADADRARQAWRLRHLPEEHPQGTTERAALDGARSSRPTTGPSRLLARALRSSAQFLADLPLTGAGELPDVRLVRGRPAGGLSGSRRRAAWRLCDRRRTRVPSGDWSAQVMTQGDLGSWFLAGRLPQARARAPPVRRRRLVQHAALHGRLPVAAVEPDGDGPAPAGSIYGVDRWTLSPAR